MPFFSKTIVFLETNQLKKGHFSFLYKCSFSKRSKKLGNFQKKYFFSENETIVFENDQEIKQKTIINRRYHRMLLPRRHYGIYLIA